MSIRSSNLLKYWFYGFFIFLFLGYNNASAQTNPSPPKETFIDTIMIYTEIGLLFTNVSIRGKSYKFLIDTGAPFVILDKNKKHFKFRKTRKSKIRDSNQQRRKVRSGIIDGVVIGKKEYSSTRAIILDLEGPILNCLDFDGIIGANIMANAIWQFDLGNNQIVVTNELELLDPDLGVPKSMRLNGTQKSPYIKVRINNHDEFEALFDSGFTNLFTLHREQFQLAKKRIKEQHSTKFFGFGSEGAFGRRYETSEYTKVDTLLIGHELFTPAMFRISEDDNSKIGAKYLKDRLVTLDFLNQKFYSKKISAEISDMSLKTFGFSPNMEDGVIVVGTIKRGSPLEKQISIGDPILKVDDMSIINSCNQLFAIREKMENQPTLSISVKTKKGVAKLNLQGNLIVE